MALNLESLLAPVAVDDRAGPDLAYDPQRHAIEQAFDAPVSIDPAGVARDESDVDWRKLIDLIAAQSERTKDIWLAVYLCRAGARSGKLEVVALGADYLVGLIERYWDDGHPSIDEYGVQARTGACDTLTSFREFLGPLRHVVIVTHPRHGSFDGDDLRRFQRGAETEGDYGAFRAALDEPSSIAALAAAVASLDAIDAAFRRVDGLLAARAGAAAGTSFAPVYDALGEIGSAARSFLPEVAVPLGEVPAEADDIVDVRRAPELDAVRSREDVVRAIDMIVTYYRRNEPGSPVPMLLARAREWVNRDFLEVLEDIAPGAIGDARNLLAFRNDQG